MTTTVLTPTDLLLLIAAVGVVLVNIITALRNKQILSAVQTQQQVTTESIMTVARDTEAIKGHVNSEKTAAQGREALLQRENHLLREMLTDKSTTARLLAQAVAVAGAIPSTAVPQPVVVVTGGGSPPGPPVPPVEGTPQAIPFSPKGVV